MERQLEEFMKGRLRTFFTERMLFFVDKIVEMHEHDRRHLNKVLTTLSAICATHNNHNFACLSASIPLTGRK